MTIKRKSAVCAVAALSVALLLSACATPPAEKKVEKMTASHLRPCMVSDSGGFDDKSFNQLGFEGIQAAAKTLGVKAITVESNTDTDYAPNIQNLLDQGCNPIVTVGFQLAAATGVAAKANPKVNFVSIDDFVDSDFDGKTDSPNVKPIVFDVAQAAFLAGYASASYSKTGIIGTFGGLNFPPVATFMDGFSQGAEYFNAQKGKSVKVLGWDTVKKDGSFTGGFEANDTAKTVAQALIDQNVDVLLPVGGPIYLSAAAAIRGAGREIALIGVDSDLYEKDPKVKDLLLTSIRKKIDVGVNDSLVEAGKTGFVSAPYIGTLANKGVEIADFHDFAGKVDPKLSSEIDAIRKDIISGKLLVKSYLVK